MPTAFLGDAHVLAGEDTAAALCRYFELAPRRVGRVVLLGDVFDLWLARPHLHEEHQKRVLESIAGARSAGLLVDYVVGNRDFGVETLMPSPFDRVASVGLLEKADSPAWIAEHGDLVNGLDRQYLRWRRFSRSPPVLGTYLALPAALGLPLSRVLERRMRTTNLSYKREFPVAQTLQRAHAWFASTGAQFLVLGHFHEERRMPVEPEGEVVVLPDWKRSRRHAEWDPAARANALRFVPSL